MSKFLQQIDYALLARQKETLVSILTGENEAASLGDAYLTDTEREHLEGLLNLIDSIQDAAEEEEIAVVWLTEE